MGRPIKKEFIGGSNVPVGNKMLAIDSAFIPGASAVSSNVSIVSQKGTGRYIVTDGTNTGLVSLVDGSNNYVPVEGEAISKVVAIGTDVETTIYIPASIKLNGAGTGYIVGDVITIPSAGTATVSTASAIVEGGSITAGTSELSSTQYTSNNASTGLAATGGTGSGATFDVTTNTITTYLPEAVSLNKAGSGYAVNDTITLTNIGVLTVTAVGTDGAISTYTSSLNKTAKSTDMAGTGISPESTSGAGTGATFDVTSTSSSTYPIKSVTLVDSGTGYSVNDKLIIGESLADYTVTEVSSASGGAIETITPTVSTTSSTTDMAGTAISGTGGNGTGATFDVTSTSSTEETPTTITEYAMKIFNRTVTTYQDHVYEWNLNISASVIGEANLTTKIKD